AAEAGQHQRRAQGKNKLLYFHDFYTCSSVTNGLNSSGTKRTFILTDAGIFSAERLAINYRF
ncbi:hypothetical protein, partial [Cronobacter malonaticus]|uniref:hypothetical protein n=1 Tax=Cronobacter malonaticus TaxID=413503 RepID=UPI0005192201